MTRESRISVVEIGTNSIKLVIARVTGGGGFQVVRFSKQTTRIGRGLGGGDRISPRAIDETVTALEAFNQHLDDDTRRFAFSTYAMRKAIDSTRTVRELEKTLGCPLRILTGREEARFAYHSARHSLRLAGQAAVLVDIGGGSTEVVFAEKNRVLRARSIPLGALHLTERFLHSDPVAPDEFAAMVSHIRTKVTFTLQSMSITKRAPTPFEIVASGGTATTIVGMIGGDRFHAGTRVRSTDISMCLQLLLPKPISERKRVPGLEPNRADIMPAGLAIASAFLRGTGKRVLRVNPGGVREGVLLHLIENNLQW
ncbi:MAG: hypothetical protein V3V49_04670 [Candidatus Krumholzibacteria bacterium]